MNIGWLKAAFSAFIAVAAFLIGDFDGMFFGLLAMVGIDFVTGLLKAAHNKNVDSRVMFEGGIKKVGIFLIVAAANVADNALGLGLALRGVVIGYYMINEAISMLENWAGLGLPLPQKLVDVLKQLQEKNE